MTRAIGWRLLFVLHLATAVTLSAQGTLVRALSIWKYLDDGTDQGTAWRELGFDDSAWKSGFAELGYGEGDEETVVGFGPDPAARYITTYFRQAFHVANPAAIATLRFRLLVDDGAVVYVNGVEVLRQNMGSFRIHYRTLADASVEDDDRFQEIVVPAPALRAGRNVVAVEVHQSSVSSSDLSFALEILADGAPPTPFLTRGPYLQQGMPTSVIVRWRTDTAGPGRVRYGPSPTNLNRLVEDPTVTTEHVVEIEDLKPATTYYYAVETAQLRVAGGDDNHYLVTSPPSGDPGPTRIWILGDSGTANSDAARVRDAYYAMGGKSSTSLVLLLGDNAYDSGLEIEYQRALFDMYADVLRTTPVWPTIGNHETAQLPNPLPTIPYFNIFTLPTRGEAGGLPSGTEKYYSFDYGNIHFICLDSMTSDRSPGGPMLTWLADDLAATSAPWIIAFWHHPPYSKGSHDSDRDIELIEMRSNAVPILEAGGADLILAGHSHSYERSFLINGHYGHSTTFTSSMKVDGGSGRDATPYRKGTTATASHVGTVYAVSGSAGKITGGPLDHPAMFISLNNLGSMVLDIDGATLKAVFLRENGTVADRFTIDKSNAMSVPSPPSSLTADATSSSSVALRWTDQSADEKGFGIERCAGTACTNFARVARTTGTSYEDSALSASTVYRYRVVAYNEAGSSTASNIVEVTTPAASRLRRRSVSNGRGGIQHR